MPKSSGIREDWRFKPIEPKKLSGIFFVKSLIEAEILVKFIQKLLYNRF